MELDNNMLHTLESNTEAKETVQLGVKADDKKDVVSQDITLPTKDGEDKIPLVDETSDNETLTDTNNKDNESTFLLIDTVDKLENENEELKEKLAELENQNDNLTKLVQSQREDGNQTADETTQLTTIYDTSGNVDIVAYRSALEVALRFKRGDLSVKTDIAYQYKNIFDELLKASNTVFGELANEMNEYVFPDVELPKTAKNNEYHITELEAIDTQDRGNDN